jgi:AcrR family transcriptional regulator
MRKTVATPSTPRAAGKQPRAKQPALAPPWRASAKAVAEGPRTQVERRAEAEMRLLETARELIARRGWTGTTLAEVGKAAGYSRGLSGHYFGSKTGLLRAITTQINNSFFEELRKAPPVAPGVAAIASFVSVYLSRTDPDWTNTRALLLLMTEALLDDSENSDQLAKYNASVLQYLEENIRIGATNGEIDRSISPGVGAEFVLGALRGVMMQRLVHGGDVGALAIRKHVVTLVRRPLAPAG